MAQLNITLNQDEILLLLTSDRDETFKRLLQESLNAILRAESSEQIGAEPYERNSDRTDSRNGIRERSLTTRIGKIILQVPRHRNAPFKTLVFDNYCRSEAALVVCMAEMVVNGVSTRKVSNVMETICGTSFSKSTVSEACKELDAVVKAFTDRPLEGRYPFVTFDATYFKMRENGRIISKAFMIAYGTNEKGLREILGFGVYDNESNATWTEFLTGLRKRGLDGILMITSDAHEGLLNAIGKVFPTVPWQRCQFHFSRNISDSVPKKYQPGIRAELQEMLNSKTLEEAREKRDRIIAEYQDVAETAMRCLDEGFEDAMTVMVLPEYLRKFYRTSNHIERLNRELKRRSKVIGVFPNEASIMRLMGSVLIERNDALMTNKAIFSSKTYDSLLQSEVPKKLIIIASEQQKLRAA
ncbi:MAG: IS256 family transposase [Eubacteriaceae bacterium]|nr:IS256 family transposase [Eubacteriaceae bacterium]